MPEKAFLALFEVLDRLHVIVGTADIHPVAVVLRAPAGTGAQQVGHQVVEAERRPAGRVEHRAADRVHAHADEVVDGRLLAEAGQGAAGVDLSTP